MCTKMATGARSDIISVMPAPLPPPPSGLVAVMAGGTADWSGGTSQTIYTAAANINGFLVIAAYGRKYTGVQPAAFQFKVNGTMWGGAASVLSLATSGAFVLPLVVSGMAPLLASGQLIEVVPALPAAGTMTFDIVGYSF